MTARVDLDTIDRILGAVFALAERDIGRLETEADSRLDMDPGHLVDRYLDIACLLRTPLLLGRENARIARLAERTRAALERGWPGQGTDHAARFEAFLERVRSQRELDRAVHARASLREQLGELRSLRTTLHTIARRREHGARLGLSVLLEVDMQISALEDELTVTDFEVAGLQRGMQGVVEPEAVAQ